MDLQKVDWWRRIEIIAIIVSILLLYYQTNLLVKQVSASVEQSEASVRQLELLVQNADVQNKLTILHSLTPKYSVDSTSVEIHDTTLFYEYRFKNLSEHTIAVNNYIIYSIYDCIRDDSLNVDKPIQDLEAEIENQLNDGNYVPILPHGSEKIKGKLDLSVNNSRALDVIRNSKGSFVVIIKKFVYVEAINAFETFIKQTGFDAGTKFLFQDKTVQLPPNTVISEHYHTIGFEDGRINIKNVSEPVCE